MSNCFPIWKKNNQSCPYGISLPMDVTKQNNATIFNRASIIGSYVVIISVGIVIYQIWNSNLHIKYKYTLSATIPVIITFNELFFKRLFGYKRPIGSCNTSCGFPSGHALVSSYLAGISLILTKYSKTDQQKTYKILFAITSSLWFITIISRVGVKDHSIPQIIAGSVEGFLFSGLIYIYFINFYSK